MDKVIEVNQLTKRFGEKTVLQNVSLEVPQGAVFGFLGNNGAGKSTFIRLILNLLRADYGQIHLFGKEIAFGEFSYRKNLGCLVESPSLYLHLTPTEYLTISQKIKGLSKTAIERSLHLVGMQKFAKQKMREFSLGMKQRIALANALMGEPKLLILDEPTNGLDPRGIQEIRELLKDLPNRLQTTVFLSSHLLDEIEKTATHIAILDEGTIKAQSTLSRLLHGQKAFLEIDSSEAVQVFKMLSKNNFSLELKSSSRVKVVIEDELDCPRIHRLIFEANLPLFQSNFIRPTLENIFLDTTGDESTISGISDLDRFNLTSLVVTDSHASV
ncbi:MAG: ATP-binding cassette domain-containing protein [Kangiellaceae bacterium]|nr:ATP-binding cassette domain-containing protein [Kangiellaceae bacterium]MCW8997134.1 ATP-binding cassette domain-containing protein [Kangiellaceae bacterium]